MTTKQKLIAAGALILALILFFSIRGVIRSRVKVAPLIDSTKVHREATSNQQIDYEKKTDWYLSNDTTGIGKLRTRIKSNVRDSLRSRANR